MSMLFGEMYATWESERRAERQRTAAPRARQRLQKETWSAGLKQACLKLVATQHRQRRNGAHKLVGFRIDDR